MQNLVPDLQVIACDGHTAFDIVLLFVHWPDDQRVLVGIAEHHTPAGIDITPAYLKATYIIIRFLALVFRKIDHGISGGEVEYHHIVTLHRAGKPAGIWYFDPFHIGLGIDNGHGIVNERKGKGGIGNTRSIAELADEEEVVH